MRAKLIVLAVGLGCGGGKESNQTPTSIEQPIEQPKVSKDPPTVAYDDTPKPTPAVPAKLPDKKPRIGEALGKAQVAVDKIVGPSEPYKPGRLHTGWGGECGVSVRAEYELGVAAVFDLGFALSDDCGPKPNLGEIGRWAGVDGDASVTVRKAPFGDDVEIWKTDAMKRSDERKRIGYILGDYLKNTKAGTGFARGEVNTVMLIQVPYGSPCNVSMLAKYRSELESTAQTTFAKLGFRKLQCGSDGAELAVR